MDITPEGQAAIDRENSLLLQNQLRYLQSRVAELAVENQRLQALANVTYETPAPEEPDTTG